MHRLLASLLLLGMLGSLGLRAQESHRRPNPAPPSSPNVFDQLEKEESASRQEERERQAAVRKQREAELARLAQELPRLISLAQDLQERLKVANLEAALPADLRQQSWKLEQLARDINKRVRKL